MKHIEILGFDTQGRETWESAVLIKPRKENLPMPHGYRLVRFADGGKLCVHETRLRVVQQ